jgi:addiction module RelE/StbE family toxin
LTNIGHENRYTPRAFSDIESIRIYIHRFNPKAAGKVVATIEKLIAGLSAFPKSGTSTDSLNARVIFTPRYPYRIYYRIVSDEVVILHIRHAARRPVKSSEL